MKKSPILILVFLTGCSLLRVYPKHIVVLESPNAIVRIEKVWRGPVKRYYLEFIRFPFLSNLNELASQYKLRNPVQTELADSDVLFYKTAIIKIYYAPEGMYKLYFTPKSKILWRVSLYSDYNWINYCKLVYGLDLDSGIKEDFFLYPVSEQDYFEIEFSLATGLMKRVRGIGANGVWDRGLLTLTSPKGCKCYTDEDYELKKRVEKYIKEHAGENVRKKVLQ